MKVSILVLFLLIIAWFFSLFMIPKESSPKINIGYINITTVYNWVSPSDIDSIITDEIEKKIKDIEWVKKITSTSSVWVSNVVVELETWFESRNVLTDIRSEVDKIIFPSSVEKPIVTEITTKANFLFQVYLYWDEKKYSQFDLLKKAKILKNNLESKPFISSVSISPSGDYEIKVLIDKSKLEQTWLSISEVASYINAVNKNTPIWNYRVWDLSYDFRFEWEFKDIEDLKNVVIKSNSSSFLKLWDIAEIKESYKSDDIKKFWNLEKKWYNFISLMVNKSSTSSVFSGAEKAKKEIEKTMKLPDFNWLNIEYNLDLSEVIIEDYKNLASTALQTLALVFITILFFVSFKEAIIATIILPLSFFVTFIFLYYSWYTLNFLTNFSLVLSLTIWIDTIIVIIEWASEKQKLGYSKKYAILLAIKEFKAPLISWTLTTLAVFLPMLILPWVMWKFLAYIPITVFSTLLAWLIIALTLSSAIYIIFAKEKKYFHKENKVEENMTIAQRDFLESERIWKIESKLEKQSFKEKILSKISKKYFNYLESTLKSRKKIKFIIYTPIILTILSLFVLSPLIGFKLFTWNDTWVVNIEIIAREGTSEKYLERYLWELEDNLSKIPELLSYWINISKSKISVDVNILKKKDRKRDVAKIEDDILSSLKYLEQNWLDVSVLTQTDWPPSSSWAVWVKLVSVTSSKFDDLKKVSDDFVKYFNSIEWIKNIKNSSNDTPWQFIFKFDNEKLSQLWLTSNDLLNELFFYTNWLKAWSIKSKFEDNDIVLKIKEFENNFSPEDILNLIINTRAWKVRIWDFVNYDFTKSVSNISRENNKVTITVSADLEAWYLPTSIQPKITKFMQEYNYPDWIYYEQWGENAENAELITATISALFIALFLIFFILVMQFNSYKQPTIILFSVLLSILWVNIWLFITQTPYSMMFMIWFISLSWVVINDAIILIDRINRNIAKWLEPIYAISLAWQSRLQPILVTTITTVLWIFPLAIQDEMWAWIGYTIMFWLFAWSMLTIFCIPLIYYNSYLRDIWERVWIVKKIFLILFLPFRRLFFLFKKNKRHLR